MYIKVLDHSYNKLFPQVLPNAQFTTSWYVTIS